MYRIKHLGNIIPGRYVKLTEFNWILAQKAKSTQFTRDQAEKFIRDRAYSLRNNLLIVDSMIDDIMEQ